MGPSRQHPTTTTFVNFAPGPLRGCDASHAKVRNPSTSAWRSNLLVRIGLLASISCVAAVKFL